MPVTKSRHHNDTFDEVETNSKLESLDNATALTAFYNEFCEAMKVVKNEEYDNIASINMIDMLIQLNFVGREDSDVDIVK